MKEIRFGIIGCGLMGREFASAIARWCHLLDVAFKPVLVGICDTNPSLFGWYQQNFPSIRISTPGLGTPTLPTLRSPGGNGFDDIWWLASVIP